MTPIINPWSIYGINILAGIETLFITIGVLSGTVIILLALIRFCEIPLTDKGEKEFKKLFIITSIILIVSILFAFFIPDKETMYTMFFLKYVTPDNINIGAEGLKSMFDYIVEAVSKLMEG